MEKVFVDANTLISGLLFPGNEAVLLKLGKLGAVQLVVNYHVMKEVGRVMAGKDFHLEDKEHNRLIKYMLECVSLVEDPSRRDIKKYLGLLKDKKDVPIVLGAKKANCEYLITGDRELLTSEKVKKLVNPVTTSKLLEKIFKLSSLP
jgi:predicted nucleic acid-binding protein